MRVLVISQQGEPARLLKQSLKEEGHVVDLARSFEDGTHLAREQDYRVVLIDREFHDADGLDLVRGLRERGISRPILLLSARTDVAERVRCIRAGADDYVVKPYSLVEVMARVDALGRRRQTRSDGNDATLLRVGDLEMDRLARRVRRAGRPIELKPAQFRVLEFLMRHANSIVTRTALFENVWDFETEPNTNVIDVHISRLRTLIDTPGSFPMIQTVRGSGYRLLPPVVE